MLALEKKHWLVCPVLPSQDWWVCGAETLLRFHWDSRDRCARPADRGGPLGIASDPAARRLRSQSLLWGGSWTRRSSWCSKQKQSNTIKAGTLQSAAPWSEGGEGVCAVLPFLAVHRHVQHRFPGEQAEQLENLLLPGDQPFLVSLWESLKQREREGRGIRFAKVFNKFGLDICGIPSFIFRILYEFNIVSVVSVYNNHHCTAEVVEIVTSCVRHFSMSWR